MPGSPFSSRLWALLSHLLDSELFPASPPSLRLQLSLPILALSHDAAYVTEETGADRKHTLALATVHPAVPPGSPSLFTLLASAWPSPLPPAPLGAPLPWLIPISPSVFYLLGSLPGSPAVLALSFPPLPLLGFWE